MFDAKYSTKEICQIFNITRETLRHYERVGLLSPHINPSNGYREYNYWDISSLIDILKYRSYGLSLADTKEALFDVDYPGLVNSLEEHTEFFSNKIKQYELLLKKATRDLAFLRNAHDHMDDLIETSIETMFFVPYTSDQSNEYFPSMQKALGNSQYFTTALVINDQRHDLDCYGFLTEKSYADLLGMTRGEIISQSPVISQMIDIVGRNPIDESMVDNFRALISKKYSRKFETVYAALISRFYDKEKRYHQYFFVFAKLD